MTQTAAELRGALLAWVRERRGKGDKAKPEILAMYRGLDLAYAKGVCAGIEECLDQIEAQLLKGRESDCPCANGESNCYGVGDCPFCSCPICKHGRPIDGCGACAALGHDCSQHGKFCTCGKLEHPGEPHWKPGDPLVVARAD